jgi:hypothetical protein
VGERTEKKITKSKRKQEYVGFFQGFSPLFFFLFFFIYIFIVFGVSFLDYGIYFHGYEWLIL